jgi:hypothetical protein
MFGIAGSVIKSGCSTQIEGRPGCDGTTCSCIAAHCAGGAHVQKPASAAENNGQCQQITGRCAAKQAPFQRDVYTLIKFKPIKIKIRAK